MVSNTFIGWCLWVAAIVVLCSGEATNSLIFLVLAKLCWLEGNLELWERKYKEKGDE